MLAVDDSPALYVYEQRGADWVQRGLIGLVAVGTGAVHPHEGVMAGPVAGRRELMEATRSNLEPILLVYNGGAEGGAELGGHGGDGRRGRGPAPPRADAPGWWTGRRTARNRSRARSPTTASRTGCGR